MGESAFIAKSDLPADSAVPPRLPTDAAAATDDPQKTHSCRTLAAAAFFFIINGGARRQESISLTGADRDSDSSQTFSTCGCGSFATPPTAYKVLSGSRRALSAHAHRPTRCRWSCRAFIFIVAVGWIRSFLFR